VVAADRGVVTAASVYATGTPLSSALAGETLMALVALQIDLARTPTAPRITCAGQLDASIQIEATV
jgi:hypothetical protein